VLLHSRIDVGSGQRRQVSTVEDSDRGGSPSTNNLVDDVAESDLFAFWASLESCLWPSSRSRSRCSSSRSLLHSHEVEDAVAIGIEGVLGGINRGNNQEGLHDRGLEG